MSKVRMALMALASGLCMASAAPSTNALAWGEHSHHNYGYSPHRYFRYNRDYYYGNRYYSSPRYYYGDRSYWRGYSYYRPRYYYSGYSGYNDWCD